MNVSTKKRPIATIRALLPPVLLALGLGAAGWGLFSIREQARPLPDVAHRFDQQADRLAVSPEKKEVVYAEYPEQNQVFGSLWIPALEQSIAIVEGTEEEDLKKGAGHFIGSVLPGIQDNCVLSGHRETVFKDLGLLAIGDQLIIETSAGIFTYEISSIRIVDKDDKTVIVPTQNATLTLTTCYPFNYIGRAPDRYILAGELVTSE